MRQTNTPKSPAFATLQRLLRKITAARRAGSTISLESQRFNYPRAGDITVRINTASGIRALRIIPSGACRRYGEAKPQGFISIDAKYLPMHTVRTND